MCPYYYQPMDIRHIEAVDGEIVRGHLSFILNGDIQQVDNIPGDMTLLAWLRQTQGLTGSKEGCGEGDCGACTAVIARKQSDGRLAFTAVNSCILLMGMIEGCAVITVEGISAPDGMLHPCQQAMVAYHGSQCGFCTPGFVMSLYAAWCNGAGLDEIEIEQTLAGNLCRCTGYRPIIDAGRSLEGQGMADWERQQHEVLSGLLDQIRHDEMIEIEAGGKRFSIPHTASEFARCVAEHPQAVIVAGATDIGLWITKQHRQMNHMIWTGYVREFHQIVTEENRLILPPAVTHQQAMAVLGDHWPAIKSLLVRFGSVQVRNSGTVCGNIANGSPIGDLPPALIAARASVRLRHADKERTLPLESFFIEYGKQDRQQGEFVSAIEIPLDAAPHLKCYKLSKRFDQDISAVMMAANITVDDGIITDAVLAFGGMAAIPKRAHHTEQALIGQRCELASFAAAAANLTQDFTPIADMRGSAEYRLQAAQNLVKKYGLEITGIALVALADRDAAKQLVS
jgi:xanthine dehydrogenase small subunit